jgi:hypothetical protein
MSQSSFANERAKLEAEAKQLADRIKAHENLIYEDRKSIGAIRAKLHRLTIVAVVGVPDGVRMRIRGLRKDRRFDDATGVVVRVMRTWALVDWGPALGRWQMPVEDLLPVDSAVPQGFLLSTLFKEAGK